MSRSAASCPQTPRSARARHAGRLVRETCGLAIALLALALAPRTGGAHVAEPATVPWLERAAGLAAAGDLEGALAAWRESAATAQAAGDAHAAARARSNAARVALHLGRVEDAQALLERAQEEIGSAPESADVVLTQISVGRAWTALGASDVTSAPGSAARERQGRAAWKRAKSLLEGARGAAQRLGDGRQAALATAALSDLAAFASGWADALALARAARTAAAAAGAEDLLALADARVGLALGALGRAGEAIDVLRRTAEQITRLREAGAALAAPALPRDAAATTTPLGVAGAAPRQHPWRPSDDAPATIARAASRALVDLLLRAAGDASDDDARQPWLREARDLVERSRVAEVRDWLRDDCAEALAARARPIDEIAGDAVVLHPIVLPDRLALLVGARGRLSLVTVDVDETTLAAEAHEMRRLLEKRTTREVLAPAERLYQRLIAPVSPLLESTGAHTLVVVPDGPLRVVPFAALRNGEHFLIERFAVATPSGLLLTDPRPMPRDDVHVLVAGASTAIGDLPALPRVREEVAAVREIWSGDALLDERFTREQTEQRLTDERFDVLHLAAHAELTADVRSAHLHTHDEPIDLARIAALVEPTRHRAHPLELLVLSACDTAAGDERSALGLAGVAVRAGARSVLGTLWRVSDDAAGELVVVFHRALHDGASRAEALQRAQRVLLARPETAHPGVWSAFVIVGSWL